MEGNPMEPVPSAEGWEKYREELVSRSYASYLRQLHDDLERAHVPGEEGRMPVPHNRRAAELVREQMRSLPGRMASTVRDDSLLTFDNKFIRHGEDVACRYAQAAEYSDDFHLTRFYCAPVPTRVVEAYEALVRDFMDAGIAEQVDLALYDEVARDALQQNLQFHHESLIVYVPVKDFQLLDAVVGVLADTVRRNAEIWECSSAVQLLHRKALLASFLMPVLPGVGFAEVSHTGSYHLQVANRMKEYLFPNHGMEEIPLQEMINLFLKYSPANPGYIAPRPEETIASSAPSVEPFPGAFRRRIYMPPLVFPNWHNGLDAGVA